MKIVSWNIERGYHPKEICQVLSDHDADIYLLTEIDRGNKRTAKVDMFARLEESLGMPGLFAVEFEELDSPWRSIIRQGGPGGGVHGNGVFSRLGFLDYRVVALPNSERLHWTGTTWIPELFEPRRGGRIAQAFEVEYQGRSLTLINTHLENWRCDWKHRRKQLECALGTRGGEGLVLAGDFNPLGGILGTFMRKNTVNTEVLALREFLAAKNLKDPFKDTDFTNFSFKTRAKLDWVALSSELQVLRSENQATPWSDHNCLVVDLDWA